MRLFSSEVQSAAREEEKNLTMARETDLTVRPDAGRQSTGSIRVLNFPVSGAGKALCDARHSQ